jgi:hypothetical protein
MDLAGGQCYELMSSRVDFFGMWEVGRILRPKKGLWFIITG